MTFIRAQGQVHYPLEILKLMQIFNASNNDDLFVAVLPFFFEHLSRSYGDREVVQMFAIVLYHQMIVSYDQVMKIIDRECLLRLGGHYPRLMSLSTIVSWLSNPARALLLPIKPLERYDITALNTAGRNDPEQLLLYCTDLMNDFSQLDVLSSFHSGVLLSSIFQLMDYFGFVDVKRIVKGYMEALTKKPNLVDYAGDFLRYADLDQEIQLLQWLSENSDGPVLRSAIEKAWFRMRGRALVVPNGTTPNGVR